MLVLTRKTGESFFIGDDIEITVRSIRGDGVRIAIDAPREVKILRSELKEAREINMESVTPEAAAIDALRSRLKK